MPEWEAEPIPDEGSLFYRAHKSYFIAGEKTVEVRLKLMRIFDWAIPPSWDSRHTGPGR